MSDASAGEGGSPPRDDEPSEADVEALLQQTREQLSTTRRAIASERESVEEQLARRRAEDRSRIARIIVYLFAGAIGLTLLAIPLLAWTLDEWSEATEKLLALLSSVLLPVVTLVIGYYFGTEQQRRG